MIISKTVLVNVQAHVSYYENLGYIIPKIRHKNGRFHVKQGTKIEIKVTDLPKSSIIKILAKCDGCGKERCLNYRDYVPLCNSCRQIGTRNHMFGKVGILNPLFNKSITNKERAERRSDTSVWKRKIKQKYNYTCQKCGYVGKKNDGFMIAHHLNSYWLFKELRTDIDNGGCVCEKCHHWFHKIYGKFTTKENWEEFISS